MLLNQQEVVKDIDLKELFNVKDSKQQTFEHLTANYDNLVSYNDVKDVFLSRKETFPMETALDMGNHTVYSVKDPTVADQGANKRYVDDKDAKRDAAILKLNTTAQSLRDLKADKTDAGANNVRITNNTTAISDLKTKKVDKFDFGVKVLKLVQGLCQRVSHHFIIPFER